MKKRRAPISIAAGSASILAWLAMGMAFTATAGAHGCTGATASPTAISSKQAGHAVTCLLNEQRARYGLPELRSSGDLKQAAKEHSAYMRRHGCFDHQCLGEASIDGRLRSAGYLRSGLSRWLYGENIAYGTAKYASPKAMVEAWMASPEHRTNILNPAFRDLGVGVVWGLPGKHDGSGGIYTTDFGLRD